MSELQDKIEQFLLPRVVKPGRYLGNEINVIKKPFDPQRVTIALVFPDVYEIGMSYLGYELLYHILNSREWIAAERVYAPWVDAEEIMREQRIPLFSLESKRALDEFDIVGFTLQYELHYTTILNMLNLAGIPLHAAERGAPQPLVLAGGPCAFNPEPLAKFIDAFVIGDAEERFVEIAELMKSCKAAAASREQVLKQLATKQGVYVPRFYRVREENGNYTGVTGTTREIPEQVSANMVEELKPEYYSVAPLVPLIEVSHDRLSLEIMRGCTRGCRFCNAGTVYRPVRERSVTDLIAQAERSLQHTGYDEVSLLSLSTSDYRQLAPLVRGLKRSFKNQSVHLSFPSLRPEMFTPEMAQFAQGERKSGLTFAPEAGTQRLRTVINKTNTNDDLLRAAKLAFDEGWTLIKLYFMLGLPTETEEDLDGITELLMQVAQLGRNYSPVRRINVSLSPFVPKAHTPFQWDEQNDIPTLERKVARICDGVKMKNVKISWRDARIAYLEGIIARGDRKVGETIEAAWRRGARLDGWSEHFNFERWREAIEETELDSGTLLGARPLDAALPWGVITKGIDTSFLRKERINATKGIETVDCKYGSCHGCGLMATRACQTIIRKKNVAVPVEKATGEPQQFGRGKKRATARSKMEHSKAQRLCYAKKREARFLSHLDMGRIFERAFKRAGVPLVYSQGYNPRPKIAYGPALPVGFASDAEYFDFHYYHTGTMNAAASLAAQLPDGIDVVESRALYGKVPSLNSAIARAEYTVSFAEEAGLEGLELNITRLMNRDEVIVARQRGDELLQFDIRPYISKITFVVVEKILYIVTNLDNGKTLRLEELIGELFSAAADVPHWRAKRTALLIRRDNEFISPMEG